MVQIIHNHRGRLQAATLCVLGLPLALSSCGDEEIQAVERARPVTALALRSIAPGIQESVPGVAEPYRVSQLAFEVGGRVSFVMDEGSEVEGALLDENERPALDENGLPLREGTVVARIEPLRYQQALDELRLRKNAAELAIDAKKIALESVSSQDLASAKAQARAAELEVEALSGDVEAASSALELASANVARYRELIKTNAISVAALDQSLAEEKTAKARLTQAKKAVEAKRGAGEAAKSAVAKAYGAIKVKQSELEVAKADLATLEQQLQQAQTNLDSCSIRAPFNGRITDVAVAQGAFVQPGSPVATLTLLDPMMVSVSVSENSNRQILMGSSVAIYPSATRAEMDESASGIGYVWEKGEVADSATRTFKVSLITRNQPRIAGADPNGQAGPATVENLFPVMYRESYIPGPLYVNSRSIAESNGEHYVYRVRGARAGERIQTLDGLFQADRIVVGPGKNRSRMLNWTFTELEDPANLNHGDLLVIDPRPELEQGFIISNKEWVYRPGDLVRVVFDLGNLPTGFYVPVQAITELNGRTSVYVIGEDQVVQEVEVEAHESWQESRRISGPGLRDGTQIVLRGSHFLAEGERVEILATVNQ